MAPTTSCRSFRWDIVGNCPNSGTFDSPHVRFVDEFSIYLIYLFVYIPQYPFLVDEKMNECNPWIIRNFFVNETFFHHKKIIFSTFHSLFINWSCSRYYNMIFIYLTKYNVLVTFTLSLMTMMYKCTVHVACCFFVSFYLQKTCALIFRWRSIHKLLVQ